MSGGVLMNKTCKDCLIDLPLDDFRLKKIITKVLVKNVQITVQD